MALPHSTRPKHIIQHVSAQSLKLSNQNCFVIFNVVNIFLLFERFELFALNILWIAISGGPRTVKGAMFLSLQLPAFPLHAP